MYYIVYLNGSEQLVISLDAVVLKAQVSYKPSVPVKSPVNLNIWDGA
jgi:hypothetical protein